MSAANIAYFDQLVDVIRLSDKETESALETAYTRKKSK